MKRTAVVVVSIVFGTLLALMVQCYDVTNAQQEDDKKIRVVIVDPPQYIKDKYEKLRQRAVKAEEVHVKRDKNCLVKNSIEKLRIVPIFYLVSETQFNMAVVEGAIYVNLAMTEQRLDTHNIITFIHESLHLNNLCMKDAGWATDGETTICKLWNVDIKLSADITLLINTHMSREVWELLTNKL